MPGLHEQRSPVLGWYMSPSIQADQRPCDRQVYKHILHAYLLGRKGKRFAYVLAHGEEPDLGRHTDRAPAETN